MGVNPGWLGFGVLPVFLPKTGQVRLALEQVQSQQVGLLLAYRISIGEVAREAGVSRQMISYVVLRKCQTSAKIASGIEKCIERRRSEIATAEKLAGRRES
jgi:predicted DNA-binding protein YlxM (UPF0122 family)